MTKYRFAAVVILGLFVALPVNAQTAPAPASAKPSATDAQKAAFLAMSEADRKAVQDALGWIGLYNGTVDGAFGKRTLDSISAYQTSVKAPPDGLVTPPQLAALKAAAQKARAAIGFQTLEDATTGIRIGAPLKLLDKRSSGAKQSYLASRDGAVTLELTALAPGPVTLDEIYKRHIGDAPDRKVTYKAIKPDTFFVVAGEAGGRKFYLRYAQAPAGASDPGALRGFIFSYPIMQAAALDPVALAVANAFEPFPTSPPASAVAPTPIPAPTPIVAAPALMATALLVAPGQALTALREADCRAPTINGKPVKFMRTDAATGLAVLGGDFGANAKAPSLSAGGSDWVVLSLAPGANPEKLVLQAGDATPAARTDGKPALVAAVLATARGAPVFDRQGGLAAIMAPLATEPKKRGSVVLAEPHDAISGEALKAFVALAELPPSAAPLGAAEIARNMRAATVGIFCAP